MQVRQDTQLAMTFPFVVFCHYSEQFYVSQAEQFSDCLSGQKQIYEIVKVIHCATLITSSYNSHAHEIAVCFFIGSDIQDQGTVRTGRCCVVLVQCHATGQRGVSHCTCCPGRTDIPCEGNRDRHSGFGLAVQRTGYRYGLIAAHYTGGAGAVRTGVSLWTLATCSPGKGFRPGEGLGTHRRAAVFKR